MNSLGRKVLVAALCALAFLGTLYVLVSQELDAWHDASAYVMRDYQRAILDGEFHAALARGAGELASFALSGNLDYLDEAREALDRARAAADSLQALARIEKPGVGLDHQQFLQLQQGLLKAVQGALDQVAALPADGRAASEALASIYGHEADGDLLWRSITAHHLAEKEENMQTLHDHSGRAHLLFRAGLVTCMLVGGLIFYYVRRRMVAPLTVLADLTRSVAAGNLAMRARVTQNDEIGQLQRSFNQMMVELGGQREQLNSLISNLASSRDTAEQANRAKSDFLANVSHELRTPMNGVLVSLELLHETAPNPDQRDLADMARTSARRLLGLLNDLLSFSRMEAGRLALQSEDFDLRALVRQMVELHGQRATAKGVAVSYRIDDALPGSLCGDPLRLGQVLLNLLDNAIKYTDHGSIEVAVALAEPAAAAPPPAPGEEAPVWLRCSVSDTGVGIAPEAAQKIFQPFYQVEGTGSAWREGLGLGLGIARELAQLMGGVLAFESTPGQGSRFWFTARLMPATRCVKAAPAAPPPGQLPPGKRVLLAEDHVNTREVMARMLQRRGLTVATAENGRQALELARAQDFDLVMMDCRMDVMDGFEATRGIRAIDGPRARVPVIALTAFGLTGTRQDFIVAGFDDLVIKPYSLEDIEAMLHRWLLRPGADDAQGVAPAADAA